MPAKPTMPRLKYRIPKGYRRDDFTPEALAEMDRNNWRRQKAANRKQKRHRGMRPLTVELPKEAWAAIKRRQAAEPGLSKTDLLTRLLLEE